MKSTIPLSTSARQALDWLKEGNARYVSGTSRLLEIVGTRSRMESLPAQHPFAVVIGCSDSRAPTEVIFDRGLGELFVIRVAGNMIATLETASVEYAVGALGVPLVVVMGHTGCGAVSASVEVITGEVRHGTTGAQPGCIQALVDRLSSSLALRLEEIAYDDHETTLAAAIRMNIQVSIDDLRHQSPYLAELDRRGDIAIVGAEYDIATGVVDFLSDRARH